MSPSSTPTASRLRGLSRTSIVAICAIMGLLLGFGSVGGVLALTRPDEPEVEVTESATPVGDAVHINTLAAGDCLGIEDTADPPRVIPKIPCDQPHTIEIINVFEFTTQTYPQYPKSEIIETRSIQECSRAKKDLPSSPGLVEKPAASSWAPTRESWDAGDRMAICYVTLESEARITGSVLDGSAQPAQ